MIDKNLKVFPDYDLIEIVENDTYSVHVFGQVRVKHKGKYYLLMFRLSNSSHKDAPREDKKFLVLDLFMKEVWKYYHCCNIKKILDNNHLSDNGITMYCEVDDDQRTEKQRLKAIYND